MSVGSPFNIDARSVLVDKLGENSERFQLSNIYLKNGKGLTAIYEIKRLRAELYDFAKDPNMKSDALKHLRPPQPVIDDKLSQEEANDRLENYRKLMKEYEIAQTAMKMQVPIPDMFAIEQYMEPFESTIHATPAVKGRRFHAFTKQVEEPQGGGFLGMGKKAAQ